VDGQTVAVLGEPGAGISSSGIVAGRLALVTGIVRRSTSDPSVFQLLPRSAADLILGPAPASSGRSAAAAVAGQASGSEAAGASAAAGTLVTVSEITGREGETVTVAGLIVGPALPPRRSTTAPAGSASAARPRLTLSPSRARRRRGGHGLVSRDADGWLIEVDPDLIVTWPPAVRGRRRLRSVPPITPLPRPTRRLALPGWRRPRPGARPTAWRSPPAEWPARARSS